MTIMYTEAQQLLGLPGAGPAIAQDPQILASPLFWCWPVDASQAPFRLAQASPQLAPESFSVDVAGRTFSLGGVGPSAILYAPGTGPPPTPQYTPEEHVALALMAPLYRYLFNEARLPNSYPQALDTLQLRPIDGRLANLVQTYGPIELYRHPTQDIAEIRLDSPQGPVLCRLDLSFRYTDNFPLLVPVSQRASLSPPLNSLVLWQSIDEDTLGPDVVLP